MLFTSNCCVTKGGGGGGGGGHGHPRTLLGNAPGRPGTRKGPFPLDLGPHIRMNLI